jgi:hypothetical protein
MLDGRYQQTNTLDTDVAGDREPAHNPEALTRSTAARTLLAQRRTRQSTATRPTGITSVWWLTSTQLTNWVAGDVWVVAP